MRVTGHVTDRKPYQPADDGPLEPAPEGTPEQTIPGKPLSELRSAAMDEKEKANTTALPTDDRPEIHQPHKSPISLEQDKDIRDGNLPADRFDDERMRDVHNYKR